MIVNAALKELLRVIRSYEIGVLAGGEHAQEFRSRIQAQLNIEIQAGHKRIVVDDPSDPGYVLKIAASYEGVLGNLNEILTYRRIVELVDMGVLPVDCKILFARTEFLDPEFMDPFIIRQVKGIVPFKNTQFIEYVKARINQNSTATPLDYWPLYITENPRYREDLKLIATTVSEHIACSDINPYEEGLNYSVVLFNGESRLMLNDMDSCIPLIINQFGQYEYPLCPSCMQPMKYLPPIVSTPITQLMDPIVSKGAYYACQTDKCRHNFQNVNSSNPFAKGEVKDINVYAVYCMNHMAEILYMYLDKCFYYIPSTPIRTYGEYYQSYISLKPTATEMEITVGFNNYINNETANTLSLLWDVIAALDMNGQIKTFTYFDFRANIHNVAVSKGIDLGPIQYRAIAFIYLSHVMQTKGDAYNVFGVYDMQQLCNIIASYAPSIYPGNNPNNMMVQQSFDLIIADLLGIM